MTEEQTFDIILLVLLGVAIVVLNLGSFFRDRAETRAHRRWLEVYAADHGLELVPGESEESLRERIWRRHSIASTKRGAQ